MPTTRATNNVLADNAALNNLNAGANITFTKPVVIPSVSGAAFGANVATALAQAANSSTGFITGSGTSTLTGKTIDGNSNTILNVPISTGVSGLASGVATFLGAPTSANLAAALTDETGTAGGFVRAGGATLTDTTLAGAAAFTGANRPTIAATGTPAANSAITRADAAWELAENAWIPISWNTPTATANASFQQAGVSHRLNLANTTAVAGNNATVTAFENPMDRNGAGANLRMAGAHFSFLMDIYTNAFNNNEYRFLYGVNGGATDISAVAGIAVVWRSPSSVVLQINNGSTLVESAPLAIGSFDIGSLHKFLLTWDGVTLRLYRKTWNEMGGPSPRWALVGTHTAPSIPNTGSGRSINITNIATANLNPGASPILITRCVQWAPYVATPV
jgi:hypothetical protein